MVCGWGGALRRMKEHGNVLLTGAEKDEIGISVFDVTSARPLSCRECRRGGQVPQGDGRHANAKWLPIRQEMLPVIAKDAGMDEAERRHHWRDLPVPHRRGAALGQVARRPRQSS
jgi:taurine transport system substrate-binding protein